MIYKIKTSVRKDFAATGDKPAKFCHNLTFEDGTQATIWEKAQFDDAVGKEFDLNIIEGKNGSQYRTAYINEPKQGGKFPSGPKNYRPDALNAAAVFAANRPEIKSADVLKIADVFLTWIKA